MYSVLIVDDEPLICEGLRQLLQHSGLDVGHVLVAHDGYEALDCIRMEDVDLIVTDIRMGEISGFDLIHQARLLKPGVPVIIISAYEDFHYAQLALRLGVKDYLVKPLNENHFLDAVREALLKSKRRADALRERKTEEHGRRFSMKEPEETCNQLLNLLLERPHDDRAPELERLRSTYGVDPGGPYYSIIRVRPKREWKSERDPVAYAALNVVCETLEPRKQVSFYGPERSIVSVVSWNEAEYADVRLDKIQELDIIGKTIHHHLKEYLKLETVVGISQIMKGTKFWPEMFTQASEAIEWHQVFPEHFVFYYGDFHPLRYREGRSLEEIRKNNNQIIEQAISYIQENYNKKEITLQEISRKIHVSPNYLSFLFKKWTGINLWDYIVKLRMEEAKRLLLTTDLRRYEIAERVGYESPEHFSKIFKKYFGVSPSQIKK